MSNIERCDECLIPFSAPGIYKTSDNICNICRDYQPCNVKGEDELYKEIKSESGKLSDFDCIVPVSGGLDSFYTIYYLKKRMGLAVLGVNYDNGMVSSSGRRVVNLIESNLKIPIVYRRYSRDQIHRAVSDSIRSLLRFGPRYMQSALCRHCGYGIRASVYNEMIKQNLNSVWGTHNMDFIPFRYCKDIGLVKYIFQENWYYALRAILGRYIQIKNLSTIGNPIFKVIFKQFGYPDMPKKYSHLKIISFFDYVPWNKKRMTSELKKDGFDTNFVKVPHSDCKLSPVVDHILRNAWTVGKKEVYVCNQVRAGQIDKEEGMKLINSIRSEELDTTFLKEIGLNNCEIERLLI